MQSSINHWVRIDSSMVVKDGSALLPPATAANSAEDIYRSLNYAYLKFFKMDLLCKWAWLGTETLLMQNGIAVYDGFDKTRIAAVIMTSHGCMDVDKKYQETLSTIPSPALFVYTLPNIMLGEICIRHGFKGEQASLVSEKFDADEMVFWVNDLLHNRNMDACLCGWVDAIDGKYEVQLFWVTKQKNGMPLTASSLQQLYNNI